MDIIADQRPGLLVSVGWLSAPQGSISSIFIRARGNALAEGLSLAHTAVVLTAAEKVSLINSAVQI